VIPEWFKQNPVIQNEKNMLKTAPELLLRSWWERYLVVEQQASTHIKWFTHKNPYGCWICDLLQMTRVLLRPSGEISDISVKETKEIGQALEELVGSAPEDTISDGRDGTLNDFEDDDDEDEWEDDEEPLISTEKEGLND